MQSVSLVSTASTTSRFDAVDHSIAWRVALGLCSSALISVVALMIWGANKGLDIDVESFYLVQYQHPELYPTFSSFHLILSKLPKLVANEIVHYRLLDLIARLLSTAALGLSVSLWLKRFIAITPFQSALLAVIAAFGGSLASCCFPRTISYNGLSSALLTASTALTFLSVFSRNSPRFSKQLGLRCMLIALAGALVGLAIFVKVTSAVALVPLLMLFLWTQKGRLSEFASVMLGVVGGILFFFCFVQSFEPWWAAFSEATKFEMLTDHSPRSLVSGVSIFAQKHWWKAALVLVGCFSITRFIGHAATENKTRLINALSAAFGSSAMLGTIFLASHPGALYSRESIAIIFALSLLLALFMVRTGSSEDTAVATRQNRLELVGGLMLLLLIPFIAAIGTNCGILPHLMSNAGPWCAVAGILALLSAERFRAPWAMATFLTALTVFSSVQFFEQYICYRDDGLNLSAQNSATEKIRLLSGLQLDQNSIEFYEQAQKILVDGGFKPGDSLLSLYDFPAIVYSMEAISPGHSWYISWPERDELNAFYFKKAQFQRGQSMYLVLSGREPKLIVEPAMQRALLESQFNKSFKRLGVLQHPRRSDFKVYFYGSNLKS